MAVTWAEAARILGYRSDGPLRRLKQQGRIGAAYLARGGGLELEPPGMPPLREHLAGILRKPTRPDQGVIAPRPVEQDRDPAIRLVKDRADAMVAMERAGLLKTQRRRLEGELVDVAEVKQLLFAHARSARDELARLPQRVGQALPAVFVGMSAEQRHAVEQLIAAEVTGVMERLSAQPLP